MNMRIAATLAAIVFASSSAIAATEITVHPGMDGCPSQAAGCYVSGSNFFTCTPTFCGNWNVHPK
jgi:hypothetical protein